MSPGNRMSPGNAERPQNGKEDEIPESSQFPVIFLATIIVVVIGVFAVHLTTGIMPMAVAVVFGTVVLTAVLGGGILMYFLKFHPIRPPEDEPSGISQENVGEAPEAQRKDAS